MAVLAVLVEMRVALRVALAAGLAAVLVAVLELVAPAVPVGEVVLEVLEVPKVTGPKIEPRCEHSVLSTHKNYTNKIKIKLNNIIYIYIFF